MPDAQNILQISKLFRVTTDYLLNDDYESDTDIPAVQTAAKETEDLFSKKKRLHLIAAICFTVSWFCALVGVVKAGAKAPAFIVFPNQNPQRLLLQAAAVFMW